MPPTCWRTRESLRFLVDENLPVDVVQVLEVDGHDVVYVAKSALVSSPDDILNAFAIESQRIIVTKDLDFPLQNTPEPPGLVILRVPKRFGRPHIRALMTEFVASDEFKDVEGRVTVVAPGRIRNRLMEDA